MYKKHLVFVLVLLVAFQFGCNIFGPSEGGLYSSVAGDVQFDSLPGKGDTTRFVWEIEVKGRDGSLVTNDDGDTLNQLWLSMRLEDAMSVIDYRQDSLWTGKVKVGDKIRLETFIVGDTTIHACCDDPNFRGCHLIELLARFTPFDTTLALGELDGLYGRSRSNFLRFQFNHNSGKYILETGYFEQTGQGSRP